MHPEKSGESQCLCDAETRVQRLVIVGASRAGVRVDGNAVVCSITKFLFHHLYTAYHITSHTHTYIGDSRVCE